MSAKHITCPKVLFRYLMRECQRLPKGPKEYYRNFIKQSFKQHTQERDPERVQEIIKRSVEDAEWIIKVQELQATKHYCLRCPEV